MLRNRKERFSQPKALRNERNQPTGTRNAILEKYSMGRSCTCGSAGALKFQTSIENEHQGETSK